MLPIGSKVIIKPEAWESVYKSKPYSAEPRTVMFIGESTQYGRYMLDSPWYWWREENLIPVVEEKKRKK
jgi:hypothetical protein